MTKCPSGGGKKEGTCCSAEPLSLNHKNRGRRILRPVTVWSGCHDRAPESRGLGKRNLLSHSSGKQKSIVSCQQDCAPSQGSSGDASLPLWLLEASGIPWLVAASLSSVSIFTCPSLFHVFSSCLIKTLIIGLRAHLGNLGCLHPEILNYICKDSFPTTSYS